MDKQQPAGDDKTIRRKPARSRKPTAADAPVSGEPRPSLAGLQRRVGNRALQRLIAQRKAVGGAFELDDDTSARIHRARGGGQPLDSAMAQRMANATGHDFSGVRVHTSPEAAGLSRQVNAVAFTTGQDVFFSEGAYQPGSTGGQQLLAHELTHVVQQGGGAAGGGRLTVNAPGDAFEQQADAVAQTALSAEAPGIQRQEDDEELEE